MTINGVKIALIANGNVIALHRPAVAGLVDADMWDLPGGGCEEGETPDECIIREVKEELGIDLPRQAIIWRKTYPSVYRPGTEVGFMVANISELQIRAIKLDHENDKWERMAFAEFLGRSDVAKVYKPRLRDYLNSI